MLGVYVFCCTVLPFIVGLLLYYDRNGTLRKFVVPLAIIIMSISAVGLGTQGAFRLDVREVLGVPLNPLFVLMDFLLLGYILLLGWQLKNRLIISMAAMQAVGLLR